MITATMTALTLGLGYYLIRNAIRELSAPRRVRAGSLRPGDIVLGEGAVRSVCTIGDTTAVHFDPID